MNTDPTHYDQNVSNREIWGTHTITTTTKRTIDTKRTQRVLRFVKAPLQTALNELRPWRYVDADFKRGKYSYGSFIRTRQREDLVDALYYYRKAHSNSNQEYDQFPSIITAYAISLYEFNRLFGDREDRCADVIRLFNEVLAIWDKANLRPEEYSETVVYLGYSYMRHYEQTKAPYAAQLAIASYERARNLELEGVHLSDRIRALSLNGSACIISTSYDLDPAIEDGELERAIGYLTEAIELSVRDPDLQARCFRNLALCHYRRYRRHPEQMDDLDGAIECNKKALVLRQDHPVTLHYLAWEYLTRYNTTNQEDDIRLAERAAEEAERLTLKGSKDLEDIRSLQSNIRMCKGRNSAPLLQVSLDSVPGWAGSVGGYSG